MNLSDRTINPLTTKRAVFSQTEGAHLPYTIDYGVMLNGDPIQSSTWKGQGLTISSTFNDTQAIAVISGRPGTYVATNTITTQGGLTDERQIALTITRTDIPQTVGADYGLGQV